MGRGFPGQRGVRVRHCFVCEGCGVNNKETAAAFVMDGLEDRDALQIEP